VTSAATAAANESAAAAMAAATTVATAATVAAATAASAGQLYGAADVFPVEEMEGGETHVRHLLLTKDEALIG